MQRQENYNGRGLRGHQLTLSKSRPKAKGSWVQTEGEKSYLALNKEERKEEGREG